MKSLQQFLGFCNYYHKFVPRFAHLAEPLLRLLAKNTPFVWGTAQQQSFEGLKTALTAAPVLALPDFSRPFVVTTDASDFAVGGTLSQPHGDVLKPVCFMSSKLHNAELNYSTTDREFLALYKCC